MRETTSLDRLASGVFVGRIQEMMQRARGSGPGGARATVPRQRRAGQRQDEAHRRADNLCPHAGLLRARREVFDGGARPRLLAVGAGHSAVHTRP